MKRLVPVLALPLLAPVCIWAQPFAGVTNARDNADGIAVGAAPSSTGVAAPVVDPRDTMPMAPPPPTAAAPVDDRTAATPVIPTPHLDPSASAAPSLPALVKRPIRQEVTEAEPGVLLVQPASTLVHQLPHMADTRMNTNGTLNGQMFNDQTETLTPTGIIDDQAAPDVDNHGGFSFGGGQGSEPAGPVEPAVAAVPSPVAPVSATQPPVTQPSIGPVKVISPVAAISSVTVASASTSVSSSNPTPHISNLVVPLTQPIAAALTFMADDITLSARVKQQLQTFSGLARGNTLASLTITQRTVAPLNALNELADARRKAILAVLKAEGVINDKTRVSEVRTRSTAATSKVTLIGR
jgi:hypothetical protein